MQINLTTLASEEFNIYNQVSCLQGTMEEKAQQILSLGLEKKYQAIHEQYLAIFKTSDESIEQQESLKRMVFLNWFTMTEPPCYTALGRLKADIINESFIYLDKELGLSALDQEFQAMLNHYAFWDYAFPVNNQNFPNIQKLILNIDRSEESITSPHLQIDKMNDRGQMGIYWISLLENENPAY
jgi:hypothetical protein